MLLVVFLGTSILIGGEEMEPKLIEAMRTLARIAALISLVVGAYTGGWQGKYQEGLFYLVLAIVLRLM
jgi:hypothetical protein